MVQRRQKARPAIALQNRIKELREVPAREIEGAPWNWRTHGDEQREALAGSLAELGITDALKAYELPDGRLRLFDGHARLEEITARVGPDTLIPVLVTDLSETEAKKANLIHDPIGDLAGADQHKLDSLMREVQTGSEGLATMLDELAERHGILEEELENSQSHANESVPSKFEVVAECADAAAQQALFERLQAEGYSCRVLTL